MSHRNFLSLVLVGWSSPTTSVVLSRPLPSSYRPFRRTFGLLFNRLAVSWRSLRGSGQWWVRKGAKRLMHCHSSTEHLRGKRLWTWPAMINTIHIRLVGNQPTARNASRSLLARVIQDLEQNCLNQPRSCQNDFLRIGGIREDSTHPANLGASMSQHDPNPLKI